MLRDNRSDDSVATARRNQKPRKVIPWNTVCARVGTLAQRISTIAGERIARCVIARGIGSASADLSRNWSFAASSPWRHRPRRWHSRWGSADR